MREFAACGADAVKFQMRNNKILFDEAAYNKPYESENSFGDTYGKHREFLELDFDSFREIAETCKNNDVDLIITPFDSPSLERLTDLDVSAIKFASFDLGNLKFLREIA